MVLTAKLISSDLVDFINGKAMEGVVHSVFDSACNIKFKNNKVITLVTPKLANFPSTIKLDVEDNCSIKDMGIHAGIEVRLANGEVAFRGISVSVNLNGAKNWDANLHFINSDISCDMVKKNLSKVREITLNYGSKDGLASILDIRYINRLAGFVLPHIESLASALKQQNNCLIKETSCRLIGFGPGLTPAADDFILGIMASLFYLGSFYGYSLDNIKTLTYSLISNIRGRTTIISEAMLKNGANGLFHEPLRSLMQAVTSREEVEEECFELLKIGETSGSDCAAGVVYGGAAVIGMNGKKEVKK